MLLPHPSLDKPVEFLKGVGPERGALLQKELNIFRTGDLLTFFPLRYEDRTKVHRTVDCVHNGMSVQLVGRIRSLMEAGAGPKKRLVGAFEDDHGELDLVWFKSPKWLMKNLKIDTPYVLHGKVNVFKGKVSIPHPELRLVSETKSLVAESSLTPIYSSTEKLTKRGLDSRGIRQILATFMSEIRGIRYTDYLSQEIVQSNNLMSIDEAIRGIHFPKDRDVLERSTHRLKFEELFLLQLNLLALNAHRKTQLKGYPFSSIGSYFNKYYDEVLPFDLTGAQKRVLREIRHDLKKECQMNRLLQGDVGSGKTVVALMSILIAIDNGYQACLMAPTEILAQQHYESIKDQLNSLGLVVGFLSGSVKGSERKLVLEYSADGQLHVLIGTHALIEETVVFKKLGLAIIDEQHRFGVAQRARLWKKGEERPPHILIMTATPIPRTLSMSLYGDLDVSVIDELPPGRKPVKTVHRNETKRSEVISFVREQVALGRQVYVVFPLIEESEALDLQDLNNGYEMMLQYFPLPKYQMSVVHGRMKARDKDAEMQRFVSGQTQIMVATTVIEVGVNVPNASVMIIENAERFGLSQLHQLRGRVGRGADQSFCILMTKYALSEDARLRIRTMCETNDGFRIAEVDLELRGPGNIQGTQQSGLPDLKIANLVSDSLLMMQAREAAKHVLEKDPTLSSEQNTGLRTVLNMKYKNAQLWSRIS